MRAQAYRARLRRWEVHGGELVRAAHPPSAVSCCDGCWEDGGDGLEVKYVVVAGLAEVDIDGGNNPAAQDEQVRRFLLLARTGSNVALRKVIPVADDAPDGCACVWRFDNSENNPHRRRMVVDVTSGGGVRGEIDVATDVSRCLCMRDEGQRRHVEVHETDVAAKKRAGTPGAGRRGDGVHLNVRRSMSGHGGRLRHRLARCSRIKRLGRDSPGLRLRMETTRASLLWQAAALRPEPEKQCLVCVVGLSRGTCIACVYNFAIDVTLTNVGARRASRKMPWT